MHHTSSLLHLPSIQGSVSDKQHTLYAFLPNNNLAASKACRDVAEHKPIGQMCGAPPGGLGDHDHRVQLLGRGAPTLSGAAHLKPTYLIQCSLISYQLQVVQASSFAFMVWWCQVNRCRPHASSSCILELQGVCNNPLPGLTDTLLHLWFRPGVWPTGPKLHHIINKLSKLPCLRRPANM